MENKFVERYKEQLERITDQEEKSYLVTRVLHQMAYYSRSSRQAKQKYQLFSLLCIIFNGVIPVLMLLTELGDLDFWVRLSTAALSAAAGILTAISGMKNYRELWIQYRVSLEELKLLVDRRFLGVGDLGSEDPKVRRDALVSQFEAIISPEHSRWRELVTEAKQKS